MITMKYLLIVIFIVSYNKNYVDGNLIFNIIDHTHDDVGWLSTPESYFRDNVTNIIENTISELEKNKNINFNWAETYYLNRWYNEQNTTKQLSLKKLVSEKRFAFAGGGWVQHDEVTTTLESQLMQMQLGLLWINNTFGPEALPKVGWQIDSFGSSPTTGTLFSLMGYQGLVLNRMPEKLFQKFKSEGNLAFIWEPSPYLKLRILVVILHSYFCTPSPIDFEPFRHGIPNYPHAPYPNDENIQSISDELYDKVKIWSLAYKSKNIPIPSGCDFTGQDNSLLKYTPMIADYINNNPLRYNNTIVKFSTLNSWISDIINENLNLKVYKGNFENYWMGFYSSRPSGKQQMRDAEALYRISEILRVFIKINKLANNKYIDDKFKDIKSNIAIFNHHDAITGTSCSGSPHCIPTGQMSGNHNVVQNYARLLNNSINDMKVTIETYSNSLLNINNNTNNIKYTHIKIFNSLSWNRSDIIEIQLPDELINKTISIIDPNRSYIDCQISQNKIIGFLATIQPFSIDVYTIINSNKHPCRNTRTITILDSIDNIIQTNNHAMNISYRLYNSNGDDSYSLNLGQFNILNLSHKFVEEGLVFTDIISTYNNIVKQTVRLINNDIYIIHNISTLPQNSELSMYIETNINSDNSFYYLANGYQIVNISSSSNMKLDESSYPLVDAAFIKDNNNSLLYITSKSQAIVSPITGCLETLLHRRTLYKDVNRWVTLDDKSSVLSKTYLSIIDNKYLINNMNHKTREIRYPLYAWLSKSNEPSNRKINLLSHKFPLGFHLFSLETSSSDNIILTGQNMNINKNIVLSPRDIFSNFSIAGCNEIILAKHLIKHKVNISLPLIIEPQNIKSWSIMLV